MRLAAEELLEHERMIDHTITPFLKWAGGKRWLVSNVGESFPAFRGRYFEPFLGSGAVFFFLRPRAAVLADANRELIETYEAVRKDWRPIVAHLRRHEQLHSPDHYYSVRSDIPNGMYARAARFIYLNRTCWNGLYRVNLRGDFNVPIGTKDKVLLPDDDFAAIAAALRHADLLCSDFEAVVDQATEGDLVYVDPPYTISHSNNGFIKYNNVLFSWHDQIRLRDAAARAVSRGAAVLISNACHESIESLYAEGFTIRTLDRASRISGAVKGRKKGVEMLIQGGTR